MYDKECFYTRSAMRHTNEQRCHLSKIYPFALPPAGRWRTYREAADTDSERQDQDVPAGTEAGQEEADEHQYDEPDQAPEHAADRASASAHPADRERGVIA